MLKSHLLGIIKGNALSTSNRVMGRVLRELNTADGLLQYQQSVQQYVSQPHYLLGGYSPNEMQDIASEIAATPFARKNFWHLEIESEGAERVGIWATDVEYSPGTVSAERRIIGSASVHSITNREPIELRVTCMDDASGSVKAWFLYQLDKVANHDGTVGVPADYCVRIKLVHSSAKGEEGAFFTQEWFRPISLESSLSRRESALEELQLTFQQMDTFFR